MQFKTIHAGNFKLDGGAMFGVVPKSIWNNLNPADELNMCNWAMRCLLVEDGNRRILIDNGIGDKQSEKFFGYYFLNGPHTLRDSLHKAGVDFSDITDVVLTHLHFDHCGGSINHKKSGIGFEPAFPNAVYWSHEAHWNHALHSNPREKASFLKENFVPIEESGQLRFIDSDLRISDHISVLLFHGHTEHMMCPVISHQGKSLVFMADLIPSAAHIPPNYVMAYDIRPLDTMSERERFLEEAVAKEYYLFFEHDLNTELGTVQKTERGFRLDRRLKLNEVFK